MEEKRLEGKGGKLIFKKCESENFSFSFFPKMVEVVLKDKNTIEVTKHVFQKQNRKKKYQTEPNVIFFFF